MKASRKDIYGRTYTKVGYIIHIVLTVIGFSSFVLLIALAGGCDYDHLPFSKCMSRATLYIIAIAGSFLLHNKIFE